MGQGIAGYQSRSRLLQELVGLIREKTMHVSAGAPQRQGTDGFDHGSAIGDDVSTSAAYGRPGRPMFSHR